MFIHCKPNDRNLFLFVSKNRLILGTVIWTENMKLSLKSPQE